MKPTFIDRLFVIWIAGAMTAWCGALTVLWTSSVGGSGAGQVGAMGAAFAALWLAAGIPGRAARAFQAVLAALRLQQISAMALAMAGAPPSTQREVQSMIRLLAVATVVAAVGGLLSTGAVYASVAAAEGVGSPGFLWGGVGWAVIRAGIEAAGMLPMAIGLAVVFLVTVMIRGGSGRDVYASVFREWLWGVACGLGALAAASWAGARPLGVAAVSCVVLVSAGGGLLQRARLTMRPRRRLPPIEASSRGPQRLAIAAGVAAVTVVLLVQMRLLRDVAGLRLSWRLAWAGLSIGLLTRLLTKVDRRSRAPGVAQGAGAAIGAIATVVLQSSLAIRCLAGGSEAVVCGLLALAAQCPLAALGATVVSRQRRLFATQGGRARQYLASVSAGVAAGAVLYLLAGWSSVAAVAALTAAVGVQVGAVVRGIGATRRAGAQLQWSLLGAVLISAGGAAPVLALRSLPAMSAGVWLTAVQAGADEADGAASAWLPGPTRWRSVTVAAVQRRVLAGRPGRWWVAAGSALDVGAELPPAVQPSWAHPDATAVLPLAERRLRRPGGGFLHGARHDRRRFDGVLLAPMPADHPEAYRCYARAVLEACAAKLHAGGTVALRTQAAAGRVADALAVARTFAKAVGSGWAAVAGRDGHVDVLLVAGQPPVSPLGPIAQPGAEAGEWACIVPLERLRLPGVARADQLARGRLLLPTVDAEQLRRHLGRGGP